MTLDRQPTISSLQLAKALHPAAAGRSRSPQLDKRGRGSQAPATATEPDAEVLAVLWVEEACWARLRTAVQGWLSCPAHRGRLPISIAAVEAGDVLLVARVGSDFSSAIAGRTATIEIEGVAGESRRWAVRASGLLQTVVPDGPPRLTGHSEEVDSQDDHGSEAGGFAVLALTITSIRGFETVRQHARP